MKSRSFKAIWVVAAFVMALLPLRGVSAITPADYHALVYNTPFYEECSGTAASDDGTAGGGGTAENGQDVFNFLVNHGLSYNQAAGVIGNLMQESGLNPKSQQAGGAGRGIAQWGVNERWRGVVKLANTQKVDPFTLGVQLDYLWQELNGSYKHALIDLKKQSSVQSATESFEKNFEAAGNPQMANRIKFAQDAYDHYKSKAPPENIQDPPSGGDTADSTSDAASSDSCAGSDQFAGTAGQNGWTLSGAHAMVIYTQTDPKWKDSAYGNATYMSTIGVSGCAPTSMAMVVATLAGKPDVTPETIASKYGRFYNIAGKDTGSGWGIFPAVAKDYGITSREIGLDFNEAAKVIKAGGLVVISVNEGYFTKSGHIMVIRAVTDDGKGFYLANPLGTHNDTPYTAEFLKGEGAAKNMWAMTK
jgi:hypothetical protein